MERKRLVRQNSVIAKVLANTETIHGFKYIADEKSSKWIRIFWIVAFVVSILCFGFYVNKVYKKLFVNPEIARRIRNIPAQSIPHPAVTMCPVVLEQENGTILDLYDKIENGNLTSDEQKDLELFCMFNSYEYDVSYLCNELNTSKLNPQNSTQMKEMFEKFYPKYEETMIMSNIFQAATIKTFFGPCFIGGLVDYTDIFKENLLSSDFDDYRTDGELWMSTKSNWTQHGKYKTDAFEVYPPRLLAGEKNSSEFYLAIDDKKIKFMGRIHQTNEIVTKFSYIPFTINNVKKTVIIRMKATSFGTSEDLMAYRPDQRGCLTDSDNYLKFFKSYTKSNCELECWTNFTLKECGCVSFFMPRDNATRVCNVTKSKCVERAEDEWTLNDKGSVEDTCTTKCLKACHYIEYEYILTDKKVEGRLKKFEKNDYFEEEYPGKKLVKFQIVFEDFTIKHHENYLAYKTENFVADCGGLLGLFIGCSMISVIEFFYHLIKILSKKRESMKKERNEVGNGLSQGKRE